MKHLTVLQKIIAAAVDFVIQSWMKEIKDFGQHSHYHMLGLIHQCIVYTDLPDSKWKMEFNSQTCYCGIIF